MEKKHKLRTAGAMILALALVSGAGYAAAKTFHPSKSVHVYGFQDGLAGQLGMGGTDESEGYVTAEGIQPVYLSDSQTVLEMKVRDGDRIRKGQVLFTYDTTLTSLALDQKRLSIERQKMDLESLKQELRQIQSYVPMPQTPAEPEHQGPDPYEALRKADLRGRNHWIYGGSGASARLPKYCWIRSGEMLDQALMRELCSQTTITYVVVQTTEDDRADGEITGEFGLKLMSVRNIPRPEETQPVDPTESQPAESTAPETTAPAESVPEETAQPETMAPVTDPPEETLPQVTEPEPAPPEASAAPDSTEPMPVPPVKPAAPAAPPAPGVPEIRCSFYDPKAVQQEDNPQIPQNSGYTALEIQQMRQEKQKQIRDLETAIHVAQSEYQVMELEASSGEVVAKTDGVVMNLISPETAKAEQKPLMRVSDGGGFYIRGAVSELKLDTVRVGQTVEISAPETGEVCQGTVVRVLEIPEAREQSSFEEDANESHYPYQVFVDQDANLREGMYVSITPVGSSDQESLYVREVFLRKENGKAYVFVRDSDGRLRKQEVTLGPGKMDDCQQVLAGITEDDYLALPFEKGVRTGAATQEGSWETLY